MQHPPDDARQRPQDPQDLHGLHQAFVDCVQLKRAFPHKFNEWNYLGEIDDYDVELIIGHNQRKPKRERRTFGSIRTIIAPALRDSVIVEAIPFRIGQEDTEEYQDFERRMLQGTKEERNGMKTKIFNLERKAPHSYTSSHSMTGNLNHRKRRNRR